MPACLGLVAALGGLLPRARGLRFAAVAPRRGRRLLRRSPGPSPASPLGPGPGRPEPRRGGLLPGVEARRPGSFWSGIDASYRLPVLIAYLALVIVTTLWPAEKNLGELIALSAASLVASQFWYLDEGGTLVLLYLPLVLLMMFRPNLTAKRPIARLARSRATRAVALPVR